MRRELIDCKRAECTLISVKLKWKFQPKEIKSMDAKPEPDILSARGEDSLLHQYSKWREAVIWPVRTPSQTASASHNSLRRFFEERKEGRGIWKWEHYFEIYDRHFGKFRNTEVHVLEIGIYSGGSLDMWQNYFGGGSHIYGVDIEPLCKAYEREGVQILIGDQADRAFWARVKVQVPQINIVIDDGGHLPNQQMVALEELLPHLQPGGVYLCEDVHGSANPFASYVHRFAHDLNASEQAINDLENPEKRIVSKTTPLQSAVSSIHLYPFVAVIERAEVALSEFRAPKHGTEWQPFLK
jgi:hypothetical protein